MFKRIPISSAIAGRVYPQPIHPLGTGFCGFRPMFSVFWIADMRWTTLLSTQLYTCVYYVLVGYRLKLPPITNPVKHPWKKASKKAFFRILWSPPVRGEQGSLCQAHFNPPRCTKNKAFTACFDRTNASFHGMMTSSTLLENGCPLCLKPEQPKISSLYIYICI